MSDYDKAKAVDTGHPGGLSPSDQGQSMEELEGSVKAFRRSPTEEPLHGVDAPEESDSGGFTNVEQHVVMDGDRGPEVHKVDPAELERTRVDQEDEIVGEYDPATNREKAVLRPRVTKQGAESEGL